MIISPDLLRKETISLLTAVEAQIKIVESEAEDKGISPSQLRDGYGNYVMIPLLSAKITAIAALAQINEADKINRQRPNPRRV
jgi:hypothetical protein